MTAEEIADQIVNQFQRNMQYGRLKKKIKEAIDQAFSDGLKNSQILDRKIYIIEEYESKGITRTQIEALVFSLVGPINNHICPPELYDHAEKTIRQIITERVFEEREACAQIAAGHNAAGEPIAQKIRARSQTLSELNPEATEENHGK